MSAGVPGPGPRVSTFSAGDVKLEKGNVFRDVKIVYEVHGQMNDDRSNVILHPTSYGAQHTDLRYRIGAGEDYTLDTSKYCVIAVNLLGNGASSSPSHANNGEGGLKVVFLDDSISYVAVNSSGAP
jgi:homoserine O-acetyltransferase